MSAIDMPGVAAQETPSGMATAALLIHIPRRSMVSTAIRLSFPINPTFLIY
jgi:hypothetical protein